MASSAQGLGETLDLNILQYKQYRYFDENFLTLQIKCAKCSDNYFITFNVFSKVA